MKLFLDWSALELEYVRLLGAGATDGLLRVYINGVLALEQTGIETWRDGIVGNGI